LPKDQKEKLKKYIEYWIDHNSSHLVKLNTKIDLANNEGLNQVAEKMKEAIEFMKKANNSLSDAFKLI
jgi:arginyl-tRNA synthetase